MKSIKDLSIHDRPREKLKKKGVKALSDFELLEVIIGSGVPGADVGSIAKEILKKFKNNFDSLSLSDLELIKGINLAKASQIMAAVEIAKRYLTKDNVKILKSADVLPFVQEYRNKKQEYFICLSLNGANNVMQNRVISVGILTKSLIHPREVFADAITDRAAGVIFVHNHPSGDIEPSEDDLEITRRLVEAGKILGIMVLDHIIITQKSYFSFKDNNLL